METISKADIVETSISEEKIGEESPVAAGGCEVESVGIKPEELLDTPSASPTEQADRLILNWRSIRVPAIPPLPVPFVRVAGNLEVGVIPQVKNPKLLTDVSPKFRAVHFSADHSGCGFWRFGMIESYANYNDKASISNINLMINAPDFWLSNFSAVRLQRQSTPSQSVYFQMLRRFFDINKLKTKMIYEVDDIIIGEKIPEFNRARGAFDKPEIRKACKEIMDLCDEFTVVSPYMKKVYSEFTSNKNITVVPNLATKGWFDGFYDRDKRFKNYEKNKIRPRILLSGGGTHYDMGNINRYAKNDYSHVLDTIISTRKDFKYVWLGTHPITLKPFIDNGEMEFHPWVSLLDFPKALDSLGCQVSMAALEYNDFNRAKSSIKLQEACYLGIPFVGQDIEPYEDAFHKFVNGDECIDIIKDICKDEDTYMADVEKHRTSADRYWMENNWDAVSQVYTTKYGDPIRKTGLDRWNAGR